jgi:ABC-type multidrug transport system ATPase subunit
MQKIVSYVDQIDRLHGYLTVKETIEFVYQCAYGGSHKGPFSAKVNDAEMERIYKELDEEHYAVEFTMKALGLKRVEDTFVGGANIRGVSGGERKRVTAAEMMCAKTFVECYDEVSTGLDAATTFDICKLIRAGVKLRTNVVLVSLLQPPPETVALFDGVIFVDNGRVLYAGPVEEIARHFESLGYQKPHQMDTADWLQSLPTPDGAQYLIDKGAAHLSNEEFVKKYIESERGQEMLQALSVPVPKDADQTLSHKWFKKRYANSSLRSLQIVFQREFLLWKRDTYQRKARLFQCLIMGVINGTVFFQVAKRGQEPQSVFGVVFQSTMFVSLGAMNKIAPQVDARGIFYKEQDADFYPTWTFVLGRALASTPSSLQDSLVYGSLIYWLVGFAPTASCYFVFLLLIQLSAFTTSLMFSVFSAIVKERPAAQAAMSMTIVLMVLFSGFTVLPSVIPPYYIWIYWCNIYAWIIRGLLVNQYQR